MLKVSLRIQIVPTNSIILLTFFYEKVYLFYVYTIFYATCKFLQTLYRTYTSLKKIDSNN